jgi:hypothetical protein
MQRGSPSSKVAPRVDTKFKAKAVGVVGLAALSGFLAFAGLKNAARENQVLEKQRMEFLEKDKAFERKVEEDNARMIFELENQVEMERIRLDIERMKQSISNDVNKVRQIEGKGKTNSAPILRKDMGRVARVDVSKLKSNVSQKVKSIAAMPAAQARNYLSKNYSSLAKSYRPLSVSQQKANRAILEPLVRDAARRNGISEEVLVKLVQQESRWDPFALNRMGDAGLTQLNPVLWNSKISNEFVCNPFNPVESIEVSAKYYSSLMKKFGDRRLALTAYNSGPARVQRLQGRGLSTAQIAQMNPNKYSSKVLSQKL